MGEHYYLFRDHELIHRNADNALGSLGAGDCHKYGQEGDILICAWAEGLRGWYWHNPQHVNDMPWKDIPHNKLDHAKYRVLLLLQQ